MGLKLFNTLTRSVQEFAPLSPPKVGMYCCGPTVYDFAHIGNWRTFVFGDLVRRYLEFKNFQVTHVMNITDVEDKIIQRVRETKTSLREFTGKYEAAFLKDLKTLNCREPHHKPRATEHIREMISLIQKLLERGIAYKTEDGSVYFSIEKYRNCGCVYGQLLNLNFEKMPIGQRISDDEYGKESYGDFALWKGRTERDGDHFWISPFGEGRPGWHIECSAMSMKVLGESFDLHLGGEDLKFPHHEDEIAQSEGATQKPFVKYWLHGAHLLVEGKKMSKSLGNFFTLRDLLAKGFNGREIRYALLQAHYRESFNFTIDGLNGAKSALARIDECVGKLREISGGATAQPEPTSSGQKLLNEFSIALDDDLNISRAWAAVFDWIRDNNLFLKALQDAETNVLNFHKPTKAAQAAGELVAWEKVNSVLGIGTKSETEAPVEIVALAEARTTAKKAKDFKRADEIRNELKSKGWTIEDTPKGPKLKKI